MNSGMAAVHYIFLSKNYYIFTEEEALKRGAGLRLDLLLTDRKTRIHGGKPKIDF